MEAAESGKGYIGYYDGGAFGIPHSSKNKDASLLFLQYIGQASVQTDWALAGSRIVMNSTYDDAKVREVVNEAAEFATNDPEPDPSELWTDILLDAHA